MNCYGLKEEITCNRRCEVALESVVESVHSLVCRCQLGVRAIETGRLLHGAETEAETEAEARRCYELIEVCAVFVLKITVLLIKNNPVYYHYVKPRCRETR